VTPYAVAGWWDGAAWVEADGAVPIPVAGGETYSVVRLDEPIASAKGSKLKEGCETNPGSSDVDIPGLDTAARLPAVAVSGVANVRPRTVTPLSASVAVYRRSAGALLAARGIDDPDGDVTQVVRADLDGDGKDEVVIVAERIEDQRGLFAKAGDYSIVFIRRLVNEMQVTTLVSESIPKPKAGETPFILSRRVSAIVDLNGDGKMELVLSNRYYEGRGMEVHELKPDGSLPLVMQGWCGA
jgi:hypothetical protein